MPVIAARNVRRLLQRFAAAEQGNIAVIFAIVLVPMLSFMGAAIDYTRANNALTAMQTAADSAALMVSRDLSQGVITSAQISTKADAYFKALYTNTDVTGVTVAATYTAPDSKGVSQVQLTTGGSIATNFMKVAGYPNLSLSSASTAKWGGTRLRVALALDTTGSMADDGKIAAMQSAAKSLITTLYGMAKTVDDIYVSVIPFAQMVNVGTGNKNAAWVRWTDFGKCTYSGNSNWNAYVSRFTAQPACVANYGTWTSLSNKNSWGGCVMDRDQSYDTTNDAPTSNSTYYPAAYSVQNGTDVCPDELLPMTSVFTSAGTDSSTDTTTIKGKINSLNPNGGTNQAIGMAWAWTSLQSATPLNAPAKDTNYQYTDTIILLSDGLNTLDRWYGDGSNPASQVDDRQKLLCDNIKTKVNGKAPTIYTIQVNTTGDAESAVLKYCADSGNFYSTSSASGLAGIFNAIGASLAKLRVAK